MWDFGPDDNSSKLFQFQFNLFFLKSKSQDGDAV